MKLKGYSLKIGKREYALKDQLTEGGFSMIYETNDPEIICKVQVLSNAQINVAYNKEKEMLSMLTHPNIVKLHDAAQISYKNQKFGLLFLENCNRGTAFNILEKSQGIPLAEKVIIKILEAAANVLVYMHNQGIAHRDIKMENVLINSKGQYKLCDFGSCSKTVITKIDASNRADIEQNIQKTTTPLYRSPEQLDLYSGFQIGTKVDIFALGVMAFMLCFQKQPFQTRLSAINKQYFLPQENSYSPQMMDLIEKCFACNPVNRPTAVEIKKQLNQISKLKKIQVQINLQKQLSITINESSRINDTNLKKSTVVAQTGFLDKIKRIYNQITTETEGWIAGFVQDNEQAPLLKYNRSIISKCYEKRYKVEKVYEIIWKYSEEYQNKSLVILKLQILLHNFLRKGPKEAITYEKEYSPIKLCTKLYKNWKTIQKPTNEADIKRNSFVCLLIRHYSLIIIMKVKLCYENSDIIQANYSIVPYLTNPKDTVILKLQFIESMINFLERCTEFHDNVQKHSYLTQIQRSMILSIIDEEYCLVSTLVFVFSAFKNAINYVKEDLDIEKLYQKVYDLEDQFQRVYKTLSVLFEKAQKFASLFQKSQFQLSPEAVKHIKSIKMENKKKGEFNITDHLNYKITIGRLKIPLTYEQVVKNPNFLKDLENVQTNQKNFVEVNQFKVKQKQSPKIDKNEKTIKNANENGKHEEKSHNAFLKKDENHKAFQNFSFQENINSQKRIEQNKKSSNLMEFTHQNLNKDFFTVDLGQDKNDQFKDFFSIVGTKFQKEKESKKQGEDNTFFKKPISTISNSSKEVFASTDTAAKNQQKKIELMNFFFEDDEEEVTQPHVSSSPSVAQTVGSKISYVSSSKEQNLIDLGVDQKKPQPIENKKKQIENLIPLEDQKHFKTEVQLPKIEIEQDFSKTFRTDNSFIDLKGFIVEEVKRNAQQYLIDFNTLTFKEKVGYGNSSEVFRGEWRGRQVAIKKIKQDTNISKSQKEFRRQIMTSVKIRHHPQLVTLIGVSEHDKYHYIINQFCNGSTLFDLLHQSNVKISWKTRINMARQIAKGMVFLHTNDPPIIHRDLKSLKFSVLLVNKYDPNNTESTQLKIADFGLSRDYASTYMTGTLGTYHWMAPQIFNNEPYTLKADVYSFGIVLWEIAARCPPYLNMKNPQSLMKFITIQNGRPDLTIIDPQCPIQIRMLMIRCWDRFPSNRPNFVEVLNCLDSLSFR